MEVRTKDRKILSQGEWFHGTTIANYKNILQTGVLVDYNRGSELDFGYGFYLAPSAELAESYIGRLFNRKEEHTEDDMPVIMVYEFCPIQWFDDETIPTCNLPLFDDEFAEFVFYNRTSGIEKAESDGKPHDFDVVYGVMSDSAPTKLILEYKAGELTKESVIESLKKSNRMKQISLHNQKLCDTIKLKRAYLFNPTTSERKELGFNE